MGCGDGKPPTRGHLSMELAEKETSQNGSTTGQQISSGPPNRRHTPPCGIEPTPTDLAKNRGRLEDGQKFWRTGQRYGSFSPKRRRRMDWLVRGRRRTRQC